MSTTRIYIVEDEALVAMDLADRLTGLGYEVCGHSARGEAALEQIPQMRPDLVLMDVRLAGEATGIETAVRLRRSMDVPVVFLSAYSDSQLVQQAKLAEPFGYLTKPFDERELHATVQVAIHTHLMERQRRMVRKLEGEVRMATGVAHEFNNLMQVIVGYLSIVQQDPNGDGIAENVAGAMRAAQTAGDIARTMLVYTGERRGALGETEVNGMVAQRSAELRSRAGPANELQLSLGEGIPLVRADERALSDVLEQLVSNSADAIGSASGAIRLATGVMECDQAAVSRSCLDEKPRPGRFVYLEVADDGCGMDAAILQHAFEPFFSTKNGRRGLGLASVHGIVRSHKGGVLVDTARGRGTRIRVILPIPDEPPPAGASRERAGETDSDSRAGPP